MSQLNNTETSDHTENSSNIDPLDRLTPCIVCNKELKSAFPNDSGEKIWQQPEQAINLTGVGDYGSSFDSLPGQRNSKFSINICDDCFRTAMDNNKVLIVETITKVTRNTYIANWELL